MTWSAVITDKDGNRSQEGFSICYDCKHANGACNVAKIGHVVGTMLTVIDVGSDGHMASGRADLHCNGFECKTE